MNSKLLKFIFPILLAPSLLGCSGGNKAISYKISFVENEHAYAFNLPEKAYAGEEITFNVGSQAGFEITEVNAYSSEASIDLNGDISLGFTFTMPEADVFIEAETLGFYFGINVNGDTTVFRTSIEEANFRYSDFIAGFRVEDEDINELSTSIRAGQKAYVLVNKLGISKNVKVFANDVEANNVALDIKDSEGLVVDTYNAYEFVMPAKDVEITLTAEENDFTVDVTYSHEGVASSIIKNKGGDITNSFKSGKRIYVNLTLNESQKDNYSLASVKAIYRPYNGYSLKEISNTEIRLSESETGNNIYTYLLLVDTLFSEDKIHIVVEFSEYEYSGKDFLGNYKGFKASETTLMPTLDNDNIRKVQVLADGVFKEDYSTFTYSDLDETNKTFKIFAGPIPKTVHYDTDMMWYPYTSDKNADICWKNWNETTSFKSSGSFATVALIELIDSNGNTLNNFLRVNGVNYTNVEIEYVGEVKDDISQCKFNIIKNGSVIASYGLN